MAVPENRLDDVAVERPHLHRGWTLAQFSLELFERSNVSLAGVSCICAGPDGRQALACMAAPARPRSSSRRCTVFRGVNRMGIRASSIEPVLTRSSPRRPHSMTAPAAPAIQPEAEDGHTFVGYAARAEIRAGNAARPSTVRPAGLPADRDKGAGPCVSRRSRRWAVVSLDGTERAQRPRRAAAMTVRPVIRGAHFGVRRAAHPAGL
jgi:hypothetical protein